MTQIGNELPNTLLGSGIDTLFGLGANDNLSGSQDGKGLMNGNQGDDTLRSRAPGDSMYGGQGNDVLVSSGGSLMFGDLGNDTLVGESTTSVFGGGQGGSDTMNGGDGNDSLVAAPGGNSILYGNAGNDTLVAKNRQDTLFGGQGDDCLEVGSFAVLAYGDLGNDKINATGSTGGATLFGGSSDIDKNEEDGNDTINSGGRNLVFGNGGDDVLTGSTGDTIRGGQGNDTINSLGSQAQVFGDLGSDVIRVSGNSTVNGGAGSDTLTATGSGNMLMDGGSEANRFALTDGASGNLVRLGPGNVRQTVDLTGAGSNNTIDGAASNGRNEIIDPTGNLITLGSGSETVRGTPQTTVIGARADDVILGGAFRQGAAGEIIGTDNAEVLQGGSGSDTIEGRGGADTLTGGAGADIFRFQGGNLGAVGIGSFSSATINGTALFVNYLYGADAPGIVLGSATFGGAAGVLPTFFGTVASGTGGAFGTAGGTLATPATTAFQFDGAGPIPFIQNGTITSNTFFNLNPRPTGTAPTLTIQNGTTTVFADASAFVIPDAGGINPSAGTFAGVGYGYATSGFDVITDFQDGTDKIFIQASMLGLSTGASGFKYGTANARTGDFQAADLAYDAQTGILYFQPSRGAFAGTVGTVLTYATEPVFQRAVVNFGTKTTAPAGALSFTGAGTAGTVAQFGPIRGGAGTYAIAQLQYTFAATAGSTVIAFKDKNILGGLVSAAGTALPIPFLQLLNGNGGPVAATINGDDITFF